MTARQAVDMLLKQSRTHLIAPPKLHSQSQMQALRKVKNRTKLNKVFRQGQRRMKQWAIEQALKNPNALQERMVWFWHNHFTSSSAKAQRTVNLVLDQDLLIRTHSIGNFGDLLRALAFNPMMLIYLDGVSNSKGKPNENFARELLELFTLGEGNYSEQDIKEVAKAFTGWRISKDGKQGVLQKKRHDNSVKTVLNKTGRLTGNDVLDILLKHPRTAEFIAEKFWREFISLERPDPNIIRDWGNKFRQSNYSIEVLLRTVLNSPAFWDQRNRASLIKSPMDFIIGTLRSLDLEDNNLPLQALSAQFRQLGQDLYTPPNVKGWPGGESWISDVTLPKRQQFLRRLMRGSNNQQKPMKNSMMKSAKPSMSMERLPQLPQAQWESWLLPIAPVAPIKSDNPERYLESLLLDPAYQLK
jgi:uncharacterized protein (DUF1800 family)